MGFDVIMFFSNTGLIHEGTSADGTISFKSLLAVKKKTNFSCRNNMEIESRN